MTDRIVVVGGGVGGLAVALGLGRTGHEVVVIEGDALPIADDPDAAFAMERRGAPQAHQTHGLLARLAVVLRERYPDVLADIEAAGAGTLPLTTDLGEPRPGDEDLAVLILRRTTLEWALRRAAVAAAGVELRTERRVVGLTGRPARPGAPGIPTVTGVRLDDGTRIDGGTVVAATGRRGDVRGWLREVGADVPEEVHETELVYLTRWYRLPDGADVTLDPRIAGDLGWVKYIGVPADGGTFSVTLAVRTGDAALRAALVDPQRFDQACHLLPGPASFFAHGPVEALGPVRPMAGLINRIRRFTLDGEPTVAGFHAVGDAHTCTNPIYGRGCALALVQAVLLTDSFAAHPGDPVARSRAYEAACRREVEPWFDVAVQMDAAGKRLRATMRERERDRDPAAPPPTHASDPLTAVFASAAGDPIIARGLMRFINLLARPDELMADAELMGRILEVVADPSKVALPERPPGPTRAELLEHLAA